MTGTLTDVEVGTEAFLSVDGVVVGHAFATADGAGQQAAGAVGAAPPAAHLAAVQTSSGGLVITTTISVPGSHLASLFGAGFRCDLNVNVVGGVLATDEGRGGGSDSGSGSLFGGGLARTGIEIAAFLALALVLLIAGNTLVQMARRRRRRLAREQNRVRDLTQL